MDFGGVRLWHEMQWLAWLEWREVRAQIHAFAYLEYCFYTPGNLQQPAIRNSQEPVGPARLQGHKRGSQRVIYMN